MKSAPKTMSGRSGAPPRRTAMACATLANAALHALQDHVVPGLRDRCRCGIAAPPRRARGSAARRLDGIDGGEALRGSSATSFNIWRPTAQRHLAGRIAAIAVISTPVSTTSR